MRCSQVRYRIGLFLLLSGLLSLPLFGQSAQRPVGSFNLRNLSFRFSIPTARPLSMGGAAIALPDDPSAATINPAGLSFFSRPAISSSSRLRSLEITEPAVNALNAPVSLADRDIFFDQSLISAIVIIKGVRLSTFRETVYDARFSYQALQPFRSENLSGTEELYTANFPSRRTTLRMQIIDNGGSVAWRFSEKLNFGASLRLTRFQYNLVERSYLRNNPYIEDAYPQSKFRPENLYLLQTIDEKKWGIGFTAGFLSRLSSRLVIGLVYNRRPAFTLNAARYFPRFEVFGVGDSTRTYPAGEDSIAAVHFDIPDSYGLGVAYKYRGWMNITFDVIRRQASQLVKSAPVAGSLNPLNLIQDDLPGGGDPESQPDLTLEDQWEFHLGIEYLFRLPGRVRLPVRAGYYYESNLIPYAVDQKPELQQRFPREKRQHHWTGGLGFFLGDKLRLDGAIDIAGNAVALVGSSVYTF